MHRDRADKTRLVEKRIEGLGVRNAGTRQRLVCETNSGGNAMDWNRVEGNWKQVKGKVKEQWGKLTDDDIDVINGRISSKAGSSSGMVTLRTGPRRRSTTGTIARSGEFWRAALPAERLAARFVDWRCRLTAAACRESRLLWRPSWPEVTSRVTPTNRSVRLNISRRVTRTAGFPRRKQSAAPGRP
jgi:CsbD-like